MGLLGTRTSLVVALIVACVTFLTWAGKVDGEAAITLLGTIVAGIVGAGAVSHGISRGAEDGGQ